MSTTCSTGKMGRRSSSLAGRRKRGIALLLVMISVVVCSILTAGFLSSQGTSIGLARNEQNAEKARGIAQSGIDLCVWLIRNRSDWRTALSPGNWLNNYAIGDGTVTVTAAETDGAGSFATNTTEAIVLTAVGSYSNRTFTLTATIGPNGGGTVFRGGNYVTGQIIMGSSDFSGSTLIDSYNSSTGSYAYSHGSNAVFGSSYASAGALMVYSGSDYNGTFIAGNRANTNNAVYATWWYNGPSSISQASQPYTLGSVEVPNTAGLTYLGSLTHGSSSVTVSGPGTFDAVSVSGSPTIKINTSGIYHITGNLSLQSLATLQVTDGVNAVFVVDGSLSMSSFSTIVLNGAGTLTMYVAGSVTVGSLATVNSGGNTANFTLLGTSANSSVLLSSSAAMVGSIYTPAAGVSMQSSTVMYGAIISNSLTMTQSAAFHYDQALTSKRIDNITGGSAPAGTADYTYKIVSSATPATH